MLHGTGGLGKSSVVSRWADRLKHDFLLVPIFGLCDETTLTQALAKALPHEAEGARLALQGAGEFAHRLAAAILACEKPLFFVLDDYEQNQDLPHTGEAFANVRPGVAPVLSALVRAVADDGHARLLITTRYQLPAASVPGLEQLPITPMDEADQQKRLARLTGIYLRAAGQPDDLRHRAITTAGGNHRLLEWLFKVLDQPGLDHSVLIAALEAKEAEFREDVFAAALCAALTPAARDLLAALQVCEEPVPLAAALALHTGPQSPATESAVAAHLATAVAWGLVYVWQIKGQPHWLAAPFLRPILGEPPAEAAPAVLLVLQKHWRDDLGGKTTESRLLELRRLAFAAGDHPLACEYAYRVCSVRLFNSRSREAAALAASTLDAIQPRRDPRLVRDLARALQVLGEGEASAALFAEAAALHGDRDMDDEKAATLFTHSGLLLQQGKVEQAERICRDQLLPFFTDKGEAGLYRRAVTLEKIADILGDRGELDEALRIRREQVLPVFEKLGDERSRAITLGRICDILSARGELDEALRIRREELLPVFEKLGDVRSCAMTLGKIAGILTDRGELDEALRIRREEQLPVFEKLGDVRTRALTQGKIADILSARGELDEALHIHREEVLPVFEKLGDVRSRAVTMGQIADILGDRGELDEALRIRREEMIPVFEKIGEVRDRAVTLGKIADILSARGELDEALRIRREEELPVVEKLGDVRERAVTLGKIADILSAHGQLEEALRIRREEVLPVYEKLGEVRSCALTLAQIADIFRVCGQLDEALFMLREEVLPVFEKLRDVRFRAMALGKIADILRARGQLDEALRMRREEELPVYEKLGDVRSLIAGRVMVAQMLVIRGNKEDVMEIVTHLAWAWREARRMGLPEAGRIEEIATPLGLSLVVLAKEAEKL
ncbi:MAG: Tetratricopeptide (TPR) repeat [Verrucomicrobia bacterium]|nr:MAG: Tetratricopeptide (TPR) repeat [Verrucomicrobiota bacterium]